MFNGKSVLITGGTGSFGQHCVRRLLHDYEPKRVVIYSRDELKQFDMRQQFASKQMRYFIGDVRDRERLTLAMRDIDYVIHAAALKQVIAAEYNPMESIKTNVLGAENLIMAAIDANVQKVIALSTDKAVNPINLYGATKLAADKLFIAANNITGKGPTLFSVVRYGNVLGSRGSVVPLFNQLIEQSSSRLPITDERMTRFWITLTHGTDFVLKCLQRMQGGELFIPKIPSIRVVGLAKAMAPNLSLKYIGIRPGEKLHEMLCSRNDAHLTLEFFDHFMIKPTIKFNHIDINYQKNALNEEGITVDSQFEYCSDTNHFFLTVDEIRQLIASRDDMALVKR